MHEEIDGPNWHDTIYCSCNHQSKSRLEFQTHRADAYKAEYEKLAESCLIEWENKNGTNT